MWLGPGGLFAPRMVVKHFATVLVRVRLNENTGESESRQRPVLAAAPRALRSNRVSSLLHVETSVDVHVAET